MSVKKLKITHFQGRSKTKSKNISNKRIGKKVPSYKKWTFEPKLKNEGIILHSTCKEFSIEYYTQCVKDLRDLITKLVQNHGFTNGAEQYKIIRNYTIDLIEGRSPENPEWLATSRKYNVPSQLGSKIIGVVVRFINKDKEGDKTLRLELYQVLNTLLYSSRIIEGLTKMDLESIEEKFKPIDDDLLNDFETYVSRKLSSWNFNKENIEKYDYSNIGNFSGYRFNLKKNGPNKVPKIESASDEAVALRQSKLWGPFSRINEEMGTDHLTTYVDKLAEFRESTNPLNDISSVNLRVLAPVNDSDFKVRTVAIVDFWSQLALEPFRAWVRFVTMKLYKEQNFTDSHDRGFEALIAFQKRCLESALSTEQEKLDIQSLKFYDFRSWTDRYHRDLQKIVVRSLFSGRFSEAWGQLVVHCPWFIPKFNREIKYGQGQGMGTNGSFDIATLTDHLFINYIYDEVIPHPYVKGNLCYGKVGDDLWVYDPENIIQLHYEKINLPINFAKSKTHCELGSVGEFCSRISIDGDDVSRVSPKVISKSTDFRYMPTLLNVCAKVGIQLESKDFDFLNNKVKKSEETYFDHLQPFLLSAFAMKDENPTLFGSVSEEYLLNGGWLTEQSIKLVQDQFIMTKFLICHSILGIVKSHHDIKDKISELSEGVNVLTNKEKMIIKSYSDDYFDISSENYNIAKKLFACTGILSPKQLIVLGRYLDQSYYVTDALMDVHSSERGVEYNILHFSKDLSNIATLSCYDKGNIAYDTKAWSQEISSFSKTLERIHDQYESLYLDSETDISLMESLLTPSDDISEVWIEWLPRMVVRPAD